MAGALLAGSKFWLPAAVAPACEADLCTKALSKPAFEALRDKLGLKELELKQRKEQKMREEQES